MQLIINQLVYTVFLRKSVHCFIFMLPDALEQITGNAHVKRPVALAGKNIGTGLFIHTETSLCLVYWSVLDSRLRGNDGKAAGMEGMVGVRVWWGLTTASGLCRPRFLPGVRRSLTVSSLISHRLIAYLEPCPPC